ncbi:hypothetical protein AALP_AA7G138200 [Arabis alpina]|uniref:DUF4005 domain-containing protein n=1 Tax=Arabis alpina TaxID=50452 RepID=A0A087GHX1_ARAAL|nr:hypothetical protein AALP_AA7G138200 [Arabis alpina]
MGRATRWFKGLFGIKPSSYPNRLDRSSFTGMSLCDSYETIPPNISEKEAAWLRSFYAEGEEEKERRTHAIAVAVATAAAADAAVVAAKAAAAVVRLTGQGKSGPLRSGQQQSRENRAAMQIQCAFRGYLARKAFRALRGVVKIQALVRGYLVRKQAAATLRSMEALVRAQATVKFQRALRRAGNATPARKSTERFSGSLENRSNSGEETAKIVEVDTGNRPGTYRIRGPVLTGSDFLDNPFRRTLSSPLSGRVPPRLSMPKPEWDECSSNKFPTAQSTPRFAGGSPSRSVCCSGEAEVDAEAHPFCFLSGEFNSSYMEDTTSFRAKLRSHSAPRQRPESNAAGGGWKKSIRGGGGVKVQRPSCSGVREAVVGNIERRRVQW